MTKLIFGVLGVILAVFVGVYIGLWVCFIGGIMGLITAVATFASSGTIAFGLVAFSILKIMLASFAGWISAVVIGIPSMALIMSA